jgi:hypothetical protein
MRFRKLIEMQDATRISVVEREFVVRGVKPKLSDLQRISEARVNTL